MINGIEKGFNHGKPVAHLFKLEVSNHDIEVFHQAGVNNLSTLIKMRMVHWQCTLVK